MTSIFDLISKEIDSNTLNNISSHIGADPQQTQSAIQTALPLILGAVSSQTSQTNATGGQIPDFLKIFLDKNHDGSIVDDVLRMATGQGQAGSQASQGFGGAIAQSVLGQIFGNKQNQVQQGLSQSTGLGSSVISKLIPLLIPIVLSAISKAKNAQGVTNENIGGMIQKETQVAREKAPHAKDLFSQMLDRDGDGSIVDDLARLGSGLFNK